MLYIHQISNNVSTNSEGLKLYYSLKPYFDNKSIVNVSFKDTSAMTSSFFNSSFGMLIEQYGMDVFKQLIKPTEINKIQAQILRKYLELYKELI